MYGIPGVPIQLTPLFIIFFIIFFFLVTRSKLVLVKLSLLSQNRMSDAG
jgi:hypothetical protein